MAEFDAEVVERVARWCADAGRQAAAREIRRALGSLSWEELLVAKALLADPPPARPLGPFALADIARGTPPDLAAEREREGRYRPATDEGDTDAVEPPLAAAPAAPPPRRRAAAKRKGPGIVIRRARDRAPAEARPPAALPLLDELRRPEGRTELERLVRRHGARRHALAAVLATRWRRPDGVPPGEEDLAALLDHHGLARAFEHRERDNVLHAIRAAGGVLFAAAARLGLEPAALESAVARLGAGPEAERIREQRRRELRSRATLSERVRLLLTEEARLRDLGLLPEFEEDLSARLPEHARALRAGRAPLALALARSLSLTPAQASALSARFGLERPAVSRAPQAPPGDASRARGAAAAKRRSNAAAPPPRRAPTGKPAAKDRRAAPGARPRPPRPGRSGRRR